jgi:hypothetical protein
MSVACSTTEPYRKKIGCGVVAGGILTKVHLPSPHVPELHPGVGKLSEGSWYGAAGNGGIVAIGAVNRGVGKGGIVTLEGLANAG